VTTRGAAPRRDQAIQDPGATQDRGANSTLGLRAHTAPRYVIRASFYFTARVKGGSFPAVCRSGEIPRSRLSLGTSILAGCSFYTVSKGGFVPEWVWVASSCLCKKREGAVLPLLIEAVKNRIDDSLHAAILTNSTMGRVRRRTSTKQRSNRIGGAQFAPSVTLS
jgi:hypothetical protein